MGWWPNCCNCRCVVIEDEFDDDSINTGWTQTSGTWTESGDYISTSSGTAVLTWTGSPDPLLFEVQIRFKASASGTKVGAFGYYVIVGTQELDTGSGTNCPVTAAVDSWVEMRIVQDYHTAYVGTDYFVVHVFVNGSPVKTASVSTGVGPQTLNVSSNTGTVDFEYARIYERWYPEGLGHDGASDCQRQYPCIWPTGATSQPAQVEVTISNRAGSGFCTPDPCEGFAGTYILDYYDQDFFGSDVPCGSWRLEVDGGDCSPVLGPYTLELKHYTFGFVSSNAPFLHFAIMSASGTYTIFRVWSTSSPAGPYFSVYDECSNVLNDVLEGTLPYCSGVTYDIEIVPL